MGEPKTVEDAEAVGPATTGSALTRSSNGNEGDLSGAQITSLHEASHEQLKTYVTDLRRAMTAENDEALNSVMSRLTAERGWIARIRPTPVEKEMGKAAADQYRRYALAKAEAFEAYTQIMMELARRQGDALLATVGVHLRAQLTAYATAKQQEVTRLVVTSRNEFLEELAPEFERIEAYRTRPHCEELYELGRQSILRQTTRYFETLDELLDGFLNALKSKVGGG